MNSIVSESQFLSEDYFASLIDLGMPEEIARSVQVSPGFSPRGTMMTGLFSLLVLLGCIGAAVALMVVVSLGPIYRFFGVVPANSLLINSESVESVVIVFCSIAATGVICNFIALCQRELSIKTALTNIQKHLNRSPKWSWYLFPGMHIRRIDTTLSRDDFLHAYTRVDFFIALFAAAGFGLLVLFALLWDGNSADVVTADAILMGGRTRLTREVVSWDRVVNVSTGAFWTGNGTVTNHRYVLHLDDGRHVDLANAKTIDRGWKPLDALAAVDDVVRRRGIPWRRSAFPDGVNAGRVQWDRSCFDAIEQRFSEADRPLFRRIFRIDD